MRLAIYPGSFDPITNGHIDIINRATLLFDKVIVAVAMNISKKPLFSVADRMKMIKKATAELESVSVDSFSGLLVNYANQKGACAVIRGLRAVSDFEFELQMALVNRKLSEKLITVFLMPHERYTYLNSSIVKEVARFGGDISCLVPKFVMDKLKERYKVNESD